MSAAQAMEGVSTRVSTLLVLTSVSVEVDTHCPAIGSPAQVSRRVVLFFNNPSMQYQQMYFIILLNVLSIILPVIDNCINCSFRYK